ncbi:DUF4232 domain-containing protein [Nocardioides mangrovi]|uniref:DUF4232 domain-containing protein n=1 Tax=Nocardioides mangrovi TaxID=2874580 RepID=A0ABS7UIB1_9ACTN|nr:DUF4232 domain-containing protein [Nocardioides mangrovi]MBZ5740540.1 DUF4232 domain-containing protein [Nocardioides mangrovi]
MIKNVFAGLVLALLAAGLWAGPAQARTGVPECTNAELVASYHGGDGATSHTYGRIALHNVSDTACWIRGYGGLSYVGHGDGTQIGAAATRTRGPEPRTTVQPGERVRSRVVETSWGPYAGRCRRAHVDGFRVYLPDETRSQYVAHPTTGCRNRHVHLLTHRAYR